jgi:hypothetical protein
VDGGYVEQGGSWRPFWLVAAVLAALVVLDAVLVPTRAPGELTAALLGAHPAATAEPGTVEP